MSTTIETYCLVKTPDDKIRVVTQDKAESLVENSDCSIVASQAFRIHQVEDLDDFTKLVPDESIRRDLLNKAIRSKTQFKIYQSLPETNEKNELVFEFNEDEAIDTLDFLNEPTRVRQTKSQKAMSYLNSLSPAERTKLLKEMLAAEEEELENA